MYKESEKDPHRADATRTGYFGRDCNAMHMSDGSLITRVGSPRFGSARFGSTGENSEYARARARVCVWCYVCCVCLCVCVFVCCVCVCVCVYAVCVSAWCVFVCCVCVCVCVCVECTRFGSPRFGSTGKNSE